MIKVRIPTPLQKLTNGKAEVECSAKTVAELVDVLDKDYPGMKDRLSEGGKIRRFINIYVNEEDIRFVNKEETSLKDGDAISIVPAIAGGNWNSTSSQLAASSASEYDYI
ncbi:MAG: molybdopterin synthase sulfur carrier subunit [Nitrospirae bacterium GWC2_57_9]|nr:MAG: molybdopterin synthase sulfur carrier subunit [Nitrospirae bacterium GWC2_57_9]